MGTNDTAEQQARDMLERIGIPHAQCMTAGDVVELANLIAELAALREEAAAHDRYVAAVHERTVISSMAYNQAHGITDGSWPDLGALLSWLLEERATLREENARLREAMVYATEHLMLGRPDLASRDIDDVLSGTAPTKEQESLAKHKDTLRRGDIASRLVSEWLEEYVREDDVHRDILLHLEGDAARSALCELEVRIMGAISVPKDAEQDAARPVSPLSTRGSRLSLEQLREIERAGWDETLQVSCCPVCMTTAGIGDGHAPDCWLARDIQSAESNPREYTNDAQDVTEEA